MSIDTLFPETYESSRARFLREVEPLQRQWPSARLEAHRLKNRPELSIDWLWAVPREREQLVIVSTAEHGIEGYVGSAMLKIFMDEYAPHIDSGSTGLLLIHAINPWGMKCNRKVNENGIDLNRNFVYGSTFDPSINPGFLRLKPLLGPSRQVRTFKLENLAFCAKLLKALITAGPASLTEAALLGQYVAPNAMYYGGAQFEEQTVVLTQLFRAALSDYRTVIHLDLHSGYGPRYQMSITVVPLEPLTSTELSASLNYPLVLRGDRTEFYATSGDMTGYIYELRKAEFPDRHVFACGFEFGTFGASMLARIRSLRAMIFETQLHWYGARDKQTEEKIRQEFKELYFPAELKWREKAAADARKAYDGILRAYNLIGG